MLQVDGLQCRYGKVAAVRDLSIEVEPGELVVLIGANGAGKTTTLKAISGLMQRRRRERIRFEGEDVTGASPAACSRSASPIVRRAGGCFPTCRCVKIWRWAAIFAPTEPASSGTWTRLFERFPILRERSEQAAGTLSGGEQQMLAISRALMSRPKLVLFDEPSLGLAPTLVAQTFDIIRQIRAEGVTVVMVEQNAFAALELCDRAYVLEQGRITKTGSGASQELLDRSPCEGAPISASAMLERVEAKPPSLNRGSSHERSPRLRSHPAGRTCDLPGLRHRRRDGRRHRRRQDRAGRQGHPAVVGKAGDRRRAASWCCRA